MKRLRTPSKMHEHIFGRGSTNGSGLSLKRFGFASRLNTTETKCFEHWKNRQYKYYCRFIQNRVITRYFFQPIIRILEQFLFALHVPFAHIRTLFASDILLCLLVPNSFATSLADFFPGTTISTCRNRTYRRSKLDVKRRKWSIRKIPNPVP